MVCDKALLAQAYADGELDSAAALEIEAHLATCAVCQRLAAATHSLHAALLCVPRRTAPPELAARIRRALDREPGAEAARAGVWATLVRFLAVHRQWFAGAVSGLAAAAVAVALFLALSPSEDEDRLANALLTAHLRSMMASHLTDVPSSDPAAVRPWFAGTVDLSPPVAQLDREGFQLVGGRADFVDGKRVAVVVYKDGTHVVNLFVWADYEPAATGSFARGGYNFRMWQTDQLVFCAISDAPIQDLVKLSKLISAQGA